MKIEIGIGGVSAMIGLTLMISGHQVCRSSCWIDNVFKLILPHSYEYLAGGLPWFLMGALMIIYVFWKDSRKNNSESK